MPDDNNRAPRPTPEADAPATAPAPAPAPTPDTPPQAVVGIGASAGGLEALERFFRAVPPASGMAYIVVQHLSVDFKSMMPELLARYTRLPVVAPSETVTLSADTIYVIVPGKEMSLSGQRLVVSDRPQGSELHLPINTLFSSLARFGRQAAAVVLSGTGSDGSIGAGAVKAAGGLVIAQTPGSARFDGMPRSTIDAGAADLVLDPERMPEVLGLWQTDPAAARRYVAHGPELQLDAFGERYAPILARLQAAFEIDFQQYKPNTIVRRIERRLNTGVDSISPQDYARKIGESRAELDQLFSELLIGVTSFFRDADAFKSLYERSVLPMALALPPTEELRIWCCGCSTGEEAYTLAMLAMEAFEQHGMTPRVRVLATDLHAPSLQFASIGSYAGDRLNKLPESLRDRYFVPQPNGQFKVSADLRRRVVFSPHNVTRDAGFTRMNVVSCRNLLIYLQQQAQTRALACFHSALLADGVLFLGESEGPGDLADLFDEADRSAKLYRKRIDGRLPPSARGLLMSAGLPSSRPLHAGAQQGIEPRAVNRLYEQLLNRYAPSGVLVSSADEVLHIFGDASKYLQPALGRFRADLQSMLSGEIKTAVFIGLRRVRETGEPVALGTVMHRDGHGEQPVCLSIDPFADRNSGRMSYMIRFDDGVPAPPPSHTVLPPNMVPVEASAATLIQDLESELHDVRETLQHTIEELEAANEELQAGNEELMAANEELQSTNEELHAVNEELYSVNAEHEIKIGELHATTADLNNLIRSTDIATLFVDAQMHLRLFTPGAVALFPIKGVDVGRDLRDFMPRAPDPSLFDDLALVIEQRHTHERELAMPDDRTLLRRISPYRNADNKVSGAVLTYIDVSDQSHMAALLRQQRESLSLFIESTPALMWSADAHGEVGYVSPQWTGYTGQPPEQLLNSGWLSEVHPDDAPQAGRLWRQCVRDTKPFRCELRLRRRDGAYHWFDARALPVTDDGERAASWHGSCTDIDAAVTERLNLREQLARRTAQAQEAQASFDAVPVPLLVIRGDGHIDQANAAAELLLGYPLAKLSTMVLEQFIPVNQHADVTDLREDFLRQPAARLDAPVRALHVIRADGNALPVTITLVPVTLESDNALVMLRESQSLMDEEARKSAGAQAKGAFLATMSHEIRTPLNAILGTSQLMLLEKPTERQAERLRRIEDASLHLLAIVNDVLDLSKVESGKLEIARARIQPREIVERATRMVEAAVRAKGLTLALRFDRQLPEAVRGDGRRIEQVLVNLLNNALKFTPEGTITVRVRAPVTQPSGLTLRFEVTDTGIGIPPERQSLLFHPFQQLDTSSTRAFGGTGLGLAICRELARAMQGEAGVSSQPGKGSTFWFTVKVLPADPAGAATAPDADADADADTDTLPQASAPDDAAPPAPARVADAPDWSGKRILVVEDDDVSRLVATELIRAVCSVKPDTASSGEEALAKARQQRYDLVLMDMHMPVMDGLATTAALRSLRGYKRTPIVALTANAFDEDKLRCLDAGMDAHVAKPLRADTLRSVLAQWLDRPTAGRGRSTTA